MSWSNAYPRPQMRRDSFLPLADHWTLNGKPIQVPWPPQAPLSGWEGPVGKDLRYETSFTLPEGFLPAGYRLLLHCGAVDQVADVYCNGVSVCHHEGGYLPFSGDLTDQLRPGENQLTIVARDTLSRKYPYGRQSKRPHGMWYTPVSGIWQPVWLEAVPAEGAIRGIRITPDLHGITVEADTDANDFTLEVPGEGLQVRCQGKTHLALTRPHLWTPEDPYLYRCVLSTGTDRVESYFALRTVSLGKINGQMRILLNGEPVFLHGVLDQGYFEDGLFLPADPAEYDRDILRMKELGYNTLRKHIKVEPDLFYYAADRLGMLVLQDMVNNGGYSWLWDTVVPTFVSKKRWDRLPGSPRRRRIFEDHVRDTQRHLYSHPCIVGYTIFNEGWGQYDSDRISADAKAEDPTRFVIAASGWFAQKGGDAQSEHVYFKTRVLEHRRPGKFLFLSECGGFTRKIQGHVQQGKKDYGYGDADTEEALVSRLQELYHTMVIPSIAGGLCGCIYTQLSDVEGEINGLYTWDRQVRKVPPAPMLALQAEIAAALDRACAKHDK